jgi:RND family efflux transporter MFP subunit
LIAVIDDAEARLDHEKALDALAKAKTQRDNAKSNLDRIKKLFENDNIALSEYESAKDDYATANSAYNTEQINTDLKKRELGYYKLYAPMDGIIAEVPIKSNEQVTPGETIVNLVSGDEIEVSVGMPEAFVSRTKTGDEVSVEFPSLPGKTFDGVVAEISFGAGTGGSTYPVTVRLEHPTSDIRPGMTADVRFTFAADNTSEEPALIVPSSAVGQDGDGQFVFTAVETGDGNAIVVRKRVSLGRLSNEGFEVVAGLQDGELVVTAGVESLSDSTTVKLLK